MARTEAPAGAKAAGHCYSPGLQPPRQLPTLPVAEGALPRSALAADARFVMPIQRQSRMNATMSPEDDIRQTVPFFAVSDMESSLRFYIDGLGFEMVDKWEDAGTVRWCRLARGGAALMLQDFRRDGGKTWSPDGPLGLGVSIMFICSDALSAYREFTARGLTPSLPFVGNGMWVTSLRDPDGYSVEFESETDAPEDTTFEDTAMDATA